MFLIKKTQYACKFKTPDPEIKTGLKKKKSLSISLLYETNETQISFFHLLLFSLTRLFL